MLEVLVNRLGVLTLPRKNVVRLTDRPDMTLDVYRGCKTTTQTIQTKDWLNISEMFLKPFSFSSNMLYTKMKAPVFFLFFFPLAKSESKK